MSPEREKIILTIVIIFWSLSVLTIAVLLGITFFYVIPE